MLKMMGKKIFTILRSKICLSRPMIQFLKGVAYFEGPWNPYRASLDHEPARIPLCLACNSDVHCAALQVITPPVTSLDILDARVKALGADPIKWMHTLVFLFVVCMQQIRFSCDKVHFSTFNP